MPYIKSEYDDLDKFLFNTGDIYFFKKDTCILHNPYGPAYITKTGYKQYFIEGKCNRLDGPAVIYSNGIEEYCINDEYLSKEKFEKHPERLKYLGKQHLTCLT